MRVNIDKIAKTHQGLERQIALAEHYEKLELAREKDRKKYRKDQNKIDYKRRKENARARTENKTNTK